MKTNDTQWVKFKIKKINKCDLKANKTIHLNFETSKGSYLEFYRHIRLRDNTQVRLISHMSHLTYMLFKIFHFIKYKILTHTWHNNISYSSLQFSVSIITWHSQIRSNEDTICLQRFVGDGFIEKSLWSFLTWEGGKEIRMKKKGYQKEFQHERS